MAIKLIYSFLTYPKKSQAEDATVSGTEVPLAEENCFQCSETSSMVLGKIATSL